MSHTEMGSFFKLHIALSWLLHCRQGTYLPQTVDVQLSRERIRSSMNIEEVKVLSKH